MAKRCSAQKALRLILEEREAVDDDIEEEVSECENYISDKWLWTSPSKKGKNVVLMSTLHRNWRICGQEHQNQRSSWIMMSTKEGWTAWTCWWLPTAPKGGPYTGHWWHSLTYWTSQHTMPLSSGWHWTQSETKGSSRGDTSSRGTGKGTGKNSNPEKTTCSKNPSLCNNHEEDSGGECWCLIHPTYRTTITIICVV